MYCLFQCSCQSIPAITKGTQFILGMSDRSGSVLIFFTDPNYRYNESLLYLEESLNVWEKKGQ